jgi:phage-related protein
MILTDLSTWLSEEGNVTDLLNGVLDLVLMLTEKFAELLPIILPAVFQLIAEISTFLTDPENILKLEESILYVVGALCVALFKSLPNILNIFTGLFSNIGKGFKMFGDNAKNSINLITSWVKNTVGNWLNSLKNTLSNAKTNLLSGISNIKTKITEFVTNIFNKIKELPSKVLSIGANITTGIWDGIKSKLDYLKNKISEFGSNIIGKIKDTFKIASPSKVTKELGGYLAEGLGLGFESEMQAVNKDIQESLPDFSNMDTQTAAGSVATTGGMDYYTMVRAFKEALAEVNIELDDQKVGRFVKKTVTEAIYH